MSKIILDLCGGTGSWAKPYKDAGYDVRTITLPEQDVRLYAPPTNVHGVLAAPPCTMFCRMRMCRGRPTDAQFIEALAVVDACLRIITVSKPKWWALENPQGYLKNWLGAPQLKFDPHEFGDPWTKRTWIWGNFAPPFYSDCRPTDSLVRKHAAPGGAKKQTGLAKNFTERAATPQGFARAFFEVNR